MSPNDTGRKGDLKELPACAPAGLHGLHAVAEGIIQEQIQLLGSGAPPEEIPDLRELLRNEGIAEPEDRSMMLDEYSKYKDEVDEVRADIEGRDDDIVDRTAGIGEVVTKAYDDIEASVGELNELIEDSHSAVQPVIDANGNPVPGEYTLPKHIVDGLFDGIWETVNTTYDEVKGVSDQAAAEAARIRNDEPSYTPTPRNNGGGVQPASYSGSGFGGGGPSGSFDSGSMGTAIISSGDKPTAMAMMQYLIDEHGFTPEQAAGIVANAKYESDFDVGATGDNGTAKGLFQWRFDRQTGLREFANNPGEDIGDWKTHIDYMVTELRGGGYQTAANAIDANANDPRAVAQAFDEHYERSSGATINKRRDYAAGLMEEWNARSGSTNSGTPTDTSVLA